MKRGVEWAVYKTGTPTAKPGTLILEELADETAALIAEIRERYLRRGDTSPGFRPEDLHADR